MASLSSPRFCPNVLYGRGGFCEETSCLAQHDAYLCELCVVICSPASNFDSHVKGRQHIHNVEQATFEPPPFVNAQSFHCAPCQKVVKEEQRHIHISEPSHLKREELAKLRAAYDLAETDKQGVSVSHADCGVDFGTVNLEQARVGELRVYLSVTSLHDVTLSYVNVCARIPSHAACFTQNVSPTPLRPGVELQVPIVFRQSQLGRYEARLELVFKKTTGREFTIARRLLAVVGEVKERDLLRPIAPYNRPIRVNWEETSLVLSGETPPRTISQKWSRALPQFKIPPPLAELLRSGPHPVVSERLRAEYFPDPLNLENYQNYFQHLLWIEEARAIHDLKIYDKNDIQFEKDGRLWKMHVHGLAEGRPSVTIGDSITAQATAEGATNFKFKGIIHEIRQEDILVSFHDDFPGERQLFKVGFQLNRTALRRHHQAMVATNPALQRLLFPDPGQEGLSAPASEVDPPLDLVNRYIRQNTPQLAAVLSMTQLKPGSAPFIVFGPPGTGKTVTIVEAILQILRRQPDARVLACAPSNSAADILALRLIRSLFDEGLADDIFRCNATSRDPASVPRELMRHCNREGTRYTLPPQDKLLQYRVIISTCNNASFAFNAGIPAGHFSHIFVDEAGQASEPEMLTAIKPLSTEATCIVLSGDPKQLGPVIRSALARQFGLEKSYLERLMDRPLYSNEYRGLSYVKLVKNYRSHSAILRYPNEQFYNGELEICGNIDTFLGSPHLVSPNFPVVFHAISGTNDREASSPSYFNIDEAVQVKAYVASLLKEGRVEAQEIGVITPYHAQVRKIRQLLANAHLADVKVGSVEEFQGQERTVIIVSTVRSSTNLLSYDAKFALGFLTNVRRFNVAMTRAKALLVVIGDAAILSIDPLWRGFMNYVHQNQGWRGDAPTWDVTAPVIADMDYADELREALAEDMNAVMAQLDPDEDLEAQANLERGFEETDACDENEWEASGGHSSEWA